MTLCETAIHSLILRLAAGLAGRSKEVNVVSKVPHYRVIQWGNG